MTNTIHLEEPVDIDFTPFEQYVDDLAHHLNIPEGWVYRPIPFMRNDFFDKMINIIGDDNMRFMASMTKRIDGDMCTRASIFVSPQGMERIATYNKLREPIPEGSEH
jgi:hypothetical protein